MRNRRFTLAAGAAAMLAGLAAALSGGGAQAAPVAAPAAEPVPPLAGLRVLVVNDDSVQGTQASGRDGLGSYALRKAMCAAGADVVTVGPWAVQSGMGGRITLSGAVTAQPVTPPAGYGSDCQDAPSGGRVYGVCAVAGGCAADSPSASPSDAARLALTRLLPDNFWADGPDVVLSGINFGQNDTRTVIHSGTVNAATVAHQLGRPAIAFSEELVVDCLRGTVSACPEFTGAAAYAADLVADLDRAGMLEPELFLNVNYPHLGDGEQLGRPVLNVLGTCSPLNFAFTGTVGVDGGTYTATLFGNPCEEHVRNADSTALEHNDISVVRLSSNATDTTANRQVESIVRGSR